MQLLLSRRPVGSREPPCFSPPAWPFSVATNTPSQPQQLQQLTRHPKARATRRTGCPSQSLAKCRPCMSPFQSNAPEGTLRIWNGLAREWYQKGTHRIWNGLRREWYQKGTHRIWNGLRRNGT
eukprot:Skav230978  [mRNA]  locus=scaffold4:105255:106524:+ [translate_table: standard]